MSAADPMISEILPVQFEAWFKKRGWQPRPHQLDLLEKAANGRSTLLIAPTGAGKTLAGFLPSLTDLAARPPRKKGEAHRGIHTLYISPLKALAVDIKRNLETPIAEMGLAVTLETRTGDTPGHRRQRQKLMPPDILLTTPEQLALLLASKDAARFFSDLAYIVLDELHSLVISKRGHLLSLGLARLRSLRPDAVSIGLSATVAEPDELCRWLVSQGYKNTSDLKRIISPLEGEMSPKVTEGGEGFPLNEVPENQADLIQVGEGAKPQITILDSKERVPWSGHSARYAIGDVYEAIKQHQTTLIFVNTRSQAELVFQELWRINEDNLPIALHHGSLDVGQRRRVEAAMETNSLKAIVATSTLDLGIDWGEVDLVVHVGAPKGASRLAQRIGRSNHRMDEPSTAILVPANRFEVLECQAALDANYLGAQDTPPLIEGALDVLAQHVLGMACAEPFDEDELYREITSATPYAGLERETFERILQFVATGGYALKNYERYAKIRKNAEGLWRVTHPKFAQQYRLNVGTIVEAPTLAVRLTKWRGKGGSARGGRVLGKVEEYFLEQMVRGDTFLFAGKVLRFEGIRENECIVTSAQNTDPKIPAYMGGKFPLSTYLADQVRSMIADPKRWKKLPPQVSEWLQIQQQKSLLPKRDQLLIETFPVDERGGRYYMIAYPFEGRLAHQTLGMLLTRRLERAHARPTGFVATDYAIAVWGLRDMGQMVANGELSFADLYDEDMLGDDLESWLADSYMLKRTFRNCALISGLIEKRHPGKEKTGRQMTISSDLIYDVLREHEPDHILMQATRADAASGLLDVRRLGDMLARIKGHIVHKPLAEISPMAVPIMLDIGRETIPGDANEMLLAEAAENLIEKAMS